MITMVRLSCRRGMGFPFGHDSDCRAAKAGRCKQSRFTIAIGKMAHLPACTDHDFLDGQESIIISIADPDSN